MTWLSVRRHVVMCLVNRILAGTHCFRAKRRLLRSVGYEIGQNTRIVGPLHCTGTLRIGSDCWIGENLTVHGNGTIRIGDRCDIAPDVTFLTGGHAVGDSRRRAGEGQNYRITVGDGSWICARATVLGNTAVGRGSVVAACACVTRDVPENTLVAGVPARTVRVLDSGDSPPEQVSRCAR